MATQPEISAELVERMVALVAEMSGEKWSYASASPYIIARGIAEDLPKPVDPDLTEARKLVAAREGYLVGECGYRSRVIDGLEDDHPAVINTLAAIKRGRELERGA